MTTSACSWCHFQNDVTAQYCNQCGHECQKARLCCQCQQCKRIEFASPRARHIIQIAHERFCSLQ